ncbi:MAG: FkbM family methyltransferase [Pyrinomonadaceae bacterium]|nr:FkbM family methyltransferase [Pyrinomonadaceae bacterium]
MIKIRQGHAANLLWKRHHRYVNGYWIGHYEFPIQNALKRLIKPGDTVFDVGANAGFFTLLVGRLVGEQGKCIAFDPSPDNVLSISEQIELNAFRQCTVVNEAVADVEGMANFSFETPGSPMGHLGESTKGEQSIKVQVTTLDRAAERFGSPSFIKVDIEGAEGLALSAAANVLREIRPIWLVELHGEECEKTVHKIMSSARYEFFDLNEIRLPSNKTLPEHFVAKPLVL